MNQNFQSQWGSEVVYRWQRNRRRRRSPRRRSEFFWSSPIFLPCQDKPPWRPFHLFFII